MTNTITLEVCQEPGGKEILYERVASLEVAVARARQYAPDTQRTILLGEGKYFLAQTLVLDHRDQGLMIAAQPGASPMLVGGRLLQNWRPDGAKLWSVDLPEVRDGQWDFRVLVVNGRLAKRARLPVAGFFQNRNEWQVPWMSTTGGRWQRKPTAAELTTMLYDPKDLGLWLDTRNAELTIYHMWDESVVGLAAMDDKTHTLAFRNPAGHPPAAFGVHKYVVWNVREGLTEPGQWLLDRTKGKLVYWPLAGEDMTTAEVIAPTMECIIRVDGKKDKPVRRLTLRGLTLSVSNTPLKAGGFGAGAFAGALQVDFADDSRILDLTIVNVGGQGIKEQGSTGLTIDGCHIHHTGACGIMFNGGTKTVQNNHLHNIGVLYPSAIALWGNGTEPQGSLMSHNEIHDVPYTAIACSGNNHRIESNLIYRAMQELHDGAGIYITFCKGITLRGNFVRDIVDTGSYGASAYYLDEQAENCLVEGNLALNVARPSHNHMARTNTLRNNVFISDRDTELTFPKCSGYALERNIIYSKGSLLFSGINALAQMQSNVLFSVTGDVKGVELDGYGSKGKPAPLEARDGTIIADPLLGKFKEGVVTFQPDSPEGKAGIKPLDVSHAGVRKRD